MCVKYWSGDEGVTGNTKMKKEKILVTGASGFVGSVLVRNLLKYGFQVVGMDNFFRDHNNSLLEPSIHYDFSFVEGDVTKIENVKRAIQDCEAVVHLAALVGEPICEKYRNMAHSVNIDGTLNVLSCLENRSLVFASTGSVYGKIEGVCNEQSPTRPLSVYGKTKLIAEEAVRSTNNTVSLRFATGMGVSPNIRFDLLVNDFVKRALQEKVLVIYQADARRTFINVRDMCSAITLSLSYLFRYPDESGKVYNCGDNDLNATKRYLAELVGKKTGCNIFYGAEGYVDPDQRDYEVDYSSIKQDLGFMMDYSMTDTIEHLIKAAGVIGKKVE